MKTQAYGVATTVLFLASSFALSAKPGDTSILPDTVAARFACILIGATCDPAYPGDCCSQICVYGVFTGYVCSNNECGLDCAQEQQDTHVTQTNESSTMNPPAPIVARSSADTKALSTTSGTTISTPTTSWFTPISTALATPTSDSNQCYPNGAWCGDYQRNRCCSGNCIPFAPWSFENFICAPQGQSTANISLETQTIVSLTSPPVTTLSTSVVTARDDSEPSLSTPS